MKMETWLQRGKEITNGNAESVHAGRDFQHFTALNSHITPSMAI